MYTHIHVHKLLCIHICRSGAVAWQLSFICMSMMYLLCLVCCVVFVVLVVVAAVVVVVVVGIAACKDLCVLFITLVNVLI